MAIEHHFVPSPPPPPPPCHGQCAIRSRGSHFGDSSPNENLYRLIARRFVVDRSCCGGVSRHYRLAAWTKQPGGLKTVGPEMQIPGVAAGRRPVLALQLQSHHDLPALAGEITRLTQGSLSYGLRQAVRFYR